MPIILGCKVRTRIRGLRPGLASLTKIALQEVAVHWHRTQLGWHFETFARTKYGYSRRHETTKEIKRDVGADPERDLVKSGRAMRWLKTAPRVTGTSKKVTLRMNSPAYFRRERAGAPDVQAEVTKISSGDRRHLARYVDRRVDALIENVKALAPQQTKTL